MIGQRNYIVRGLAAPTALPYIIAMSDEHRPESSEHGAAGKTRTKWHPLLVRLLTVSLDSAFKVEQEVSVGKMPLRVDILLIRREGGQLSEAKARDIVDLLALLNRFTLIEFKAPTDALEPGDFAQLVGCGYLWHSQQSERHSCKEISLIVVAPAVNAAHSATSCGSWAVRSRSTSRGFSASSGCPLRHGSWKPTPWPSADSRSSRW